MRRAPPGFVATDTFALALIDPGTNEVVSSTALPQGVSVTVVDDTPWLIGADRRTDTSGIRPAPIALEPGERILTVTSAGVWITDVDGAISLEPCSGSRVTALCARSGERGPG
ncbi:MAG: hypothetical protein ABI869_05275 [Actinomycetota bacterium]